MKISALALGWLAVLTQYAAGQPVPQSQRQPDVFLVTVDTLRADHLHCYGYQQIRTPAIDHLAGDGFRFTEAFTPSPITNTSHVSIMTGLLPATHNVSDFAIPLDPAAHTWAELLKQNGYQTAAFIGAIILDSRVLSPGLDRGFDFYDNFPADRPMKSRWGRIERRGMDVVQRAEAWLAAHPQGRRFVWIHLYDPHDPYEPPPPYAKIYEGRLYDGEIAYADSAIANFVAFLKQRKWYRESLVILVADHGEGLGEHGEETHGVFLYDSTTHVPLIFKLPDRAPGGVIQGQVETIDILPTVLDLLNIPLPGRLDGESLAPHFGSPKSASRPVYAETEYPLRFGWAPLRSIRAEGFKFIEAPRPELYDLSADPGELTNRYEPWSPAAQRLRERLLRGTAQAAHPASSAAEPSAGTLAELRALGYLGPRDADRTGAALPPSLWPDPKDKIQEQNLFHAAMIALESDRHQEALRALEKLVAIDPDSAAALLQLGVLELRSGRYAKASGYLKRARELRPGDATAALHEGRALKELQDLAGARRAVEASLEIDPRQPEAHILLGQIAMALKDPGDAVRHFEAALLLQPNSFEAQLERAKAEIANGSFADAVGHLGALAKSRPSSAVVFELLARADTALGKTNDARRAGDRARFLRATSKRP